MSIRVIVVTPEKTALDMQTNFVVLPLFDGEYGVLSGHSPLIARLGAGELRIAGADGQQEICYVEGGFAEIRNDTVALMTMYIVPAKDLDLALSEELLQKAEASPADSHELLQIRHEKLHNARTRVRIAQKMAGNRND